MPGPSGYTDHLVLSDTGTGYPDITASDGMYTGYLTTLASTPGHYNIRTLITDNDGASVTPRRRGGIAQSPTSENLCCGSELPLHDIVPSGKDIIHCPWLALCYESIFIICEKI